MTSTNKITFPHSPDAEIFRKEYEELAQRWRDRKDNLKNKEDGLHKH